MTTSDQIAFVACIVSIAAFIVSFRALRYARKSFDAQYSPDILIDWKLDQGILRTNNNNPTLNGALQTTELMGSIKNTSSNIEIADVAVIFAIIVKGHKTECWQGNILNIAAQNTEKFFIPSLEQQIIDHFSGVFQEIKVAESETFLWSNSHYGNRDERGKRLVYYSVKDQTPIILDLAIRYKASRRPVETLTTRAMKVITPLILENTKYQSPLNGWQEK